MKIHQHATDGKTHLFLMEVAQRQRGPWGGYVELRTIQTNDAMAKRIDSGEQTRFIDTDGLEVLNSAVGNVNATGPRSQYAKALKETTDTFNTEKTNLNLRDGYMHLSPPERRPVEEAQASKKALLEGLDKPFVACEQHVEQTQKAQRRM